MHLLSTIAAIIAALANPCAMEDSTNCYWNANSHGNNHGVSFVSIDDVNYYANGKIVDYR